MRTSYLRTGNLGAGRRGARQPAGRQRGMTFLGILILVAFVGIFVYGGLKLTPVYLEYMNVARSMDSLRNEAPGSNPNALRVALQKRFDIDDVQSITVRDVEITRDGENWIVRAAWERTTPFVANVGFIVTFDKSVEVPAS